ncbi:MAG: Uma2 family endonuclease [Cyclobacteriaceae bacterium]
MEQAVVDQKIMSSESYLEAEQNGTKEEYGKFEYHNGTLVEIGGASKEHNRISMNLSIALGSQLLDTSFEVFHSDMRTHAPKANSYFYPDLVVSQGGALFRDDEFDNLTNPVLVIEILSDSTSAKDRGTKFAAYRSIDSLQEYLLVSTKKQLIEHYQRQQQNEWKLTIYQEEADEVSLLEGQVSLSLNDIYRNVKTS